MPRIVNMPPRHPAALEPPLVPSEHRSLTLIVEVHVPQGVLGEPMPAPISIRVSADRPFDGQWTPPRVQVHLLSDLDADAWYTVSHAVERAFREFAERFGA